MGEVSGHSMVGDFDDIMFPLNNCMVLVTGPNITEILVK